MKKTDSSLHIRYVKSSDIGQVIEELKEIENSLSHTVRNYLMLIRGYEILKNKNINQKKLEQICLDSLHFFLGNSELAKINLEQCKSNSDISKKSKAVERNKLKQNSSQYQFASEPENFPESEKDIQPKESLPESKPKEIPLIDSLMQNL